MYSERDIADRQEVVAAALERADVFFGSLLFDYDQVRYAVLSRLLCNGYRSASCAQAVRTDGLFAHAFTKAAYDMKARLNASTLIGERT